MKHTIRRSISACLGLSLAGAMLVLAGCPKAVPLEKQSTRAYLLSVREAEPSAESDAPASRPPQEVRLYAIELDGTLPPGAAAEALSIPAAAAPLDEGAPERPRTLYRLAVEGEQLTLEQLAGRDLLLTVAEPRDEVLADLRLLLEIQEMQGTGTEPFLDAASLGPLGSLTRDANLRRLSQAAEAEATATQLQVSLGATEAALAPMRKRLETLAAERATLMETILGGDSDDPAATRAERLRVAEIDIEAADIENQIAPLERNVAEQKALLSVAAEKSLSDNEIEEMRKLVHQSLTNMKGAGK